MVVPGALDWLCQAFNSCPLHCVDAAFEMDSGVVLTSEQETLLVPLYCKARCDTSLLDDVTAREILEQLDYDFARLRIPRKTCLMMCLRALQFDAFVSEYVGAHPDAVVVHLGCGLDSRCRRVVRGDVNWYDLDMPAVIDLRSRFYQETERYHLVASSVTDLAWTKKVLSESSPVLVVAEGLFMYLSSGDVRSVILGLARTFPGCHLVFDAFSAFTARRMGAHPSIRMTGARVQWGIDDAREIEEWGAGIRLREERFFPQFIGVERLDVGYRMAFRLSSLIPAARRAHRILYFEL